MPPERGLAAGADDVLLRHGLMMSNGTRPATFPIGKPAVARPQFSRCSLRDGGRVVDPGCEAEEVMDAGQCIVVRWRGWGTARASRIPVDWHEAHTYVVREGLITEVREFRTWEKALDAAGARE